jgi:hypothetical protein
MVKAPSTKDFRKEQIEKFKMRMELETMKCIAITDLSVQETIEPGSLHHTELMENLSTQRLITLSVFIEQMKNLPKTDVFRGADPYRVIFWEGAPGLFQTEVRRGKRKADWTWDPRRFQAFQTAING